MLTYRPKWFKLKMDRRTTDISYFVFFDNFVGHTKSKGRLSIPAPIGTAMLGFEVGDIFERDVPAGKRQLQIEKNIYQPESSGDFHL